MSSIFAAAAAMDRERARAVLEEVIKEYSGKSFAEWKKFVNADPIALERTADGVEYQVKIQVTWDSPKEEVLRIWYSIDDFSFLAACRPVTITDVACKET
jgi:hypothetical protein